MAIERKTFKSEHGFIDYNYSINERYPYGLLIFLGSYVEKDFRGKGIFKYMVNELFKMFPKETEVHLAIANKHLVKYFKRKGFKETNQPLVYWGKPENTTNMKGYI